MRHYYKGCPDSNQGNDTTVLEQIECIECLNVVPIVLLDETIRNLEVELMRFVEVRRKRIAASEEDWKG